MGSNRSNIRVEYIDVDKVCKVLPSDSILDGEEG